MKKGFTLIELLAVIVILAIIALIATPIVLSIINDTKESATFRSAEYYLDAVRVGSAFTGKMSTKEKFGLKAVGEFETNVNQIEKITKGQTIGYGKRFVDKLRNTYHDVKNFIKTPKIYANINNRNYEIISGIRMNDIIVDITNSTIKPGDKVKLKTNPVLVDTNIERRYI